MRSAADVAGFLAGVAGVVVVMLSAVRTFVLPRAVNSRIAKLTTAAVRASLRLWAGRYGTYERRDGAMAMLAPVALLAMIFTWLVLLLAAYALMFFCSTGRSLSGCVALSGSSLVTLGTSSDPRLGPSLLAVSEAALGLLLVALFITYFPSIYGAFTRRETGVTLLQARAGSPPQATTMLIRFHRIRENVDQIGEVWRQWETWFADIEESHTTFQILAFFRSPQPDRSWVTAAGAILDAASLWTACLEHRPDPDAQLCIRSGFLALRRIADGFGIAYDGDPSPDGPVSITRGEWSAALDEMEAAGVPVVTDREAAWQAWRGWRVNYDTCLLRLARLTEAPPAPWTSDRSPVSPFDRTGDGRRSRRRR